MSYTDPEGLRPDARPVGPTLGSKLGNMNYIQAVPPQPRPDNAEPSSLQPKLEPFPVPRDFTKYCATAECAAGLPPTLSDNRSQPEIYVSGCKLACRLSSAACFPFSLAGGLPVTAACQAAVQVCVRNCEPCK